MKHKEYLLLNLMFVTGILAAVDTNVGWYICSAAIYANIGMVML